MKQPVISVVVPVYNVEPYLKRCLDSIISQTYTNLEIILVDDGSTDGCSGICDQYASKDSRIVVIHKENGGLSDARNVGIENVSGEYVTCIDSDDFVSEFYVENLYIAIKEGKTQISCSAFVEYFDGNEIGVGKKVSGEDVKVLKREKFFEKMLYQNEIDVSVWAKMYKSTIFTGIQFPKGRLYEDSATTYKLIDKVENIAVVSNKDYFYYQRPGSIARGVFNPQKMDFITYTAEMCSHLVRKYPELEVATKSRYYSACCNVLFQIPRDTFRNEEKYIWNEMKAIRNDVLFDKKSRKKNRLGALISYFGIRVMRIVYTFVSR